MTKAARAAAPQSVDRIFAILDHLAAHPEGESLAGLARTTGAPKTSLVGLLAGMVESEHLARDDRGTYRLGPRLVSLVGSARAKQWVMFAESIDAAAALSSGFAQWNCPRGEAERVAIERARDLCARPLAAVMMTKQTINALGAAAKPVVHMDTDQFALTLGSEDFQEGVASFLEKRPPRFNQGLPEPEPSDSDR